MLRALKLLSSHREGEPPSEPRTEDPGSIFATLVTALRRPTARSAWGVLTLNGTSRAFGFVTALVLARMLGPAEYGAYAYAWAWLLLLAVPATFGLDQLLVREIAAYTSTKRPEDIDGIRRWGDRVGLAAAVIISAGALAVLPVLPRVLDPILVGPLGVAALLLPLFVLIRLRRATMHGLKHIVAGSAAETLVQPAATLLGVLFVFDVLHVQRDAIHAMTVVLGAAILAVVFGSALLKHLAGEPGWKAGAGGHSAAWIRSAVPLMLISGMFLISARVDTLMLGAMRGSGPVGLYAVAARGAELVLVPLQAMIMAIAPRVSALHTEGNRRHLQQLLTNTARAATLISLPAILAFILFPAPIVGIFGHQFRAGAPVLVILTAAQTTDILCGPVGMLLLMTGRERISARVVGIAVVLNVALNAALIPPFGPVGAALATAVSIVFRNVTMVVVARRELRLDSTALGLLVRRLRPRSPSGA